MLKEENDYKKKMIIKGKMGWNKPHLALYHILSYTGVALYYNRQRKRDLHGHRD